MKTTRKSCRQRHCLRTVTRDYVFTGRGCNKDWRSLRTVSRVVGCTLPFQSGHSEQQVGLWKCFRMISLYYRQFPHAFPQPLTAAGAFGHFCRSLQMRSLSSFSDSFFGKPLTRANVTSVHLHATIFLSSNGYVVAFTFVSATAYATCAFFLSFAIIVEDKFVWITMCDNSIRMKSKSSSVSPRYGDLFFLFFWIFFSTPKAMLERVVLGSLQESIH